MELKENMVLLDQAPATKKEAIRLAGELLVKEGCVDERYNEVVELNIQKRGDFGGIRYD